MSKDTETKQKKTTKTKVSKKVNSTPAKKSVTKKAPSKKSTKVTKTSDMLVVFKVGGSQVMAKVGEEVVVENISATKGDKLVFDEVLLTYDGKKTTVGTPTVKGLKVNATVLSVKKGKKISGMKYKAKARYRKRFGSRPVVTRFSVDSVSK